MNTKFQIDRHFLFLHGHNLTVFAERVLRKSQMSSYIPTQEDLWEELNAATAALHKVLNNPQLKRKERTEAVREKEAPVLLSLSKLATYIEKTVSCKSDIFTTGFRPHNEHRKVKDGSSPTRRRQRVSAKLAKLQEE